jgi:hypothetical protein
MSRAGSDDLETGEASVLKKWTNKASTYHSRLPYLRKLPFSALAIIITLIVINEKQRETVCLVELCLTWLLATFKRYYRVLHQDYFIWSPIC